MPYIGKQPDFNTVGTDELTDNAVTNAKIVDDISFTSITGSVVSASTAIVAGVYSGGVMSGSAQTAINLPRGVVSSSAQLMSGSVGVMSGSAQTKANLPTGTVSASMGISGSASSTGSFGSTHVMGNLNIGTVTASPSASVVLGSSDASVTVSGSIFPEGDNNHDLGSANYRWRYIYTTDLKLSNEGTGGNSVDGTEGNWTVEEGEEDLFVTNVKSGKKFRIKLEEIE